LPGRDIALVAMLAGGAACSSTGGAELGASGYGDPAGEDGSSGPDQAESAGGSGGTGVDPGFGTDADDDESSGGSSSGDEPPPSPGELAGCPDRWPDGWVFCEDFEALDDPHEVFFDYSDAGGKFTLQQHGGASGLGAMKATYSAGVEAAGFLSVSFGESPIDKGTRPNYAPDTSFDEVYWRFRVKMEAGWPDIGPHKLTRATAFAGPDWGQAMVASLASDGDGVTLAGSGATCVFGGEVACQGYEDASLDPLLLLPGVTPLFSEDLSGQWHCVEAHVKLNSVGLPDGVFEFWVDGQLENGGNQFDWRGEWSDYGLNLITIENFWTGGAPLQLDRWIDDVVISSQPIGCD
jgi:hypothetical protein